MRSQQRTAIPRASLSLALLAVAYLIACGVSQEATGREADPQWLGYGDDSNENRFVPLTQINAANVQQLALEWSLDLAGENALEATPLEAAGVLYFSGSFATVYAVDVRTGRLLWRFYPKANEAKPREMRRVSAVNRGVAYWDGKVYVATGIVG
jgi:quinohemoprotein ethanol dehydrogenase